MCSAIAGSREKEFFSLVFSVLFAIVLAEIDLPARYADEGL